MPSAPGCRARNRRTRPEFCAVRAPKSYAPVAPPRSASSMSPASSKRILEISVPGTGPLGTAYSTRASAPKVPSAPIATDQMRLPAATA